MSGVNISGKIMVQEAQADGFEARVYRGRIEAAIQLLRVEIRRAVDPDRTINDIELAIDDLVAREKKFLED